MPIDQYITNNLFHLFLVFCRVGGCFMLLPGFGEAYVSPRVRLCFALIVSLALAAAIPNLPDMPVQATSTLVIITHELMVGLLIGGIIKIIFSSLHVAGTIIALQSSLGQATLFDVTQQTQGAIFGTVMQMIGVVLIFSLDYHHMMINGMIQSYNTFNVSSPLDLSDFSELATKAATESFSVGVQMAAPLIVVGLIVNIISGILARLMPAFQVFFVIAPLQIVLAFFVFMATLSAMLTVFLTYMNGSLTTFFN